MTKIIAFEKYVQQYESWFTRNRWVYEAELRAVKSMMPPRDCGVEIGVGTGRFAEPLSIKFGLEPSAPMRQIAKKRGLHLVGGIAEELPFGSLKLDFVLMVTTVCFVDDIHKSLAEAYRILADGGSLIVGLVDSNSPLGQIYRKHQKESLFYQEATFFSVEEITACMTKAGFTNFAFRQTIFRGLPEITETEPVKCGYGQGSFVVIRGEKEEY